MLGFFAANAVPHKHAHRTANVQNNAAIFFLTADLAYDAMTKGMDDLEDYYLMDGGIITVNTETAAALGIDYSVFNDMGEVVEVTTTEE